jgi:hypothetical protein
MPCTKCRRGEGLKQNKNFKLWIVFKDWTNDSTQREVSELGYSKGPERTSEKTASKMVIMIAG